MVVCDKDLRTGISCALARLSVLETTTLMQINNEVMGWQESSQTLPFGFGSVRSFRAIDFTTLHAQAILLL